MWQKCRKWLCKVQSLCNGVGCWRGGAPRSVCSQLKVCPPPPPPQYVNPSYAYVNFHFDISYNATRELSPVRIVGVVGWCDVLGKYQCRGVLLTWIIIEQGSIVLPVAAWAWGIFFFVYHLCFSSPLSGIRPDID